MRLAVGARRGVAALVLVAVLSALAVAPGSAGPAAAGEPFVLGTGAASGQVVKARLFYAGFSLQVALGLAATTYENAQSRALGAGYDLSSVLGLVDVDVPELSPVSIDSNAGDAAERRDLGAGPALGSIALRATTVPASSAEVRLADVDLPGLVRVQGGHARSTSSVVGGGTRRAEATVTLGSVSLLDGLIVLDGLRWDVVHETGAAARSDGTFTVGRLLVAGFPLATDLHDLDPVLDLLNAALAPVGLVLTGPELLPRDNGSVGLSPLRIGLVSSPLGAEVLGPIVAGVRPLLVPVYEALTDVNGTLGLTSLVADLGLGVADGSGGIELAIGGATALTDDTVFADPLDGGAPAPGPPAEVAAGPGPSGPVAVAVPGTSSAPGLGSQVVRTATAGPARCVLEASPRRQGRCRGSNVAGAVAIVALVAVAIGTHDLRVRRRLVAGPGAVPTSGAAP